MQEKLKLIFHNCRQSKTHIHKLRYGTKLQIRENTNDYEIIQHREKPVEDLLFNKIKLMHREMFVDIGAHICYYTLQMAIKYPTNITIAIEPDIENIYAIRNQQTINQISNLQVYHSAISDSFVNEKMNRYVIGNRLMYGHTSLLNLLNVSVGREIKEQFDIDTVTLDSILNKVMGYYSFIIKMDIEGMELKALKGMTDTLERTRCIIIEIHNPTDKFRIENILIDNKFKCMMITNSHIYGIKNK